MLGYKTKSSIDAEAEAEKGKRKMEMERQDPVATSPLLQIIRHRHISHHRADAAVAFFVATVAAEARLGYRFDGLFNRAARAVGWESPVDRSGDG